MKRQCLKILMFFIFFSLLLSSCSSSKVSGKIYKRNVEVSYYADKFDGRKTASGEKFNNNKLTAAHRTLPFGTKLKVTNPVNGESVVVEVNDRGPHKKGRELDLSKRAFMEITHNKDIGILKTEIEILK